MEGASLLLWKGHEEPKRLPIFRSSCSKQKAKLCSPKCFFQCSSPKISINVRISFTTDCSDGIPRFKTFERLNHEVFLGDKVGDKFLVHFWITLLWWAAHVHSLRCLVRGFHFFHFQSGQGRARGSLTVTSFGKRIVVFPLGFCRGLPHFLKLFRWCLYLLISSSL